MNVFGGGEEGICNYHLLIARVKIEDEFQFVRIKNKQRKWDIRVRECDKGDCRKTQEITAGETWSKVIKIIQKFLYG